MVVCLYCGGDGTPYGVITSKGTPFSFSGIGVSEGSGCHKGLTEDETRRKAKEFVFLFVVGLAERDAYVIARTYSKTFVRKEREIQILSPPDIAPKSRAPAPFTFSPSSLRFRKRQMAHAHDIKHTRESFPGESDSRYVQRDRGIQQDIGIDVQISTEG